MCGIAGLVDLRGTLAPAELAAACRAMCDAMAHRGPDDHGVWLAPEGRVALGHRRLAVIDPSPAGHQPMVAAADDGGVLVFNGELYNFRTLRAELEAAGHAFAGRTDTEVLLAGLDLEGAGFLPRLDGMYGFGHYDRRRRRLLLARDGFGEKPLYTYRAGGLFAFASELTAFTGLPGFDDGVTLEAIAGYLAFQYVPAPQAIYRAAAKLPPGHHLILEADGRERLVRHFRFETSSAATGRLSLDDLASELEERLLRTLDTRLIADVPLGAFLSGGVDSATVVALIRRRLNRPLRTFSIGFANCPESEHEDARAMAAHLGTDHTDRIVQAEAGVMGRQIGTLLDEPNGDSSCLPTYLLSGLARQSVTVALSGDGGDELFGGYTRYFATLADQDRQPAGWRPGPAYYSTRLLVFPEPHLAEIMGQVPAALSGRLAALRDGLDRDPRPLINRLREADAGDYLPGAVLAKVDRMSMRHALEVRAPLLGREVAAFAAGLAARDCADATGGKAVLKTLARRYLPAGWVDRPKRGFGLPMRAWGEQPVFETVSALLRPGESRLAEWLGQPPLERFLERQRHTPWMYQLWAVLILESWLRRHPARPA